MRECVPVGAGESTRAAIAAHDVYNVGEFKDDQLQGHKHTVQGGGDIWYHPSDQSQSQVTGSAIKTTSDPISDGTNGTPRTGTTTHGKQLGVNYLIKY